MARFVTYTALVVGIGISACAPKPPLIPGGTTADPTLQADVSKTVMLYEEARGQPCKGQKIVNSAVLEKGPDGHTKAERWTVDRCGQPVNYHIDYISDGQGGTYFVVKAEH